MTNIACPEFRHLTQQLNRRKLIQLGSLGAIGLTLPELLAARSSVAADTSTAAFRQSPLAELPGFGKAKQCILMFMWGGPSQLETWDLKPHAPAEVRGEFKPIATSVPGIDISEHFPNLAKRADRYAIIRSVTHDDPAHLSSVHHVMTGRHAAKVKSDADAPSRIDWPHVGSVLGKLCPPSGAVPPFITLPWVVSHPAAPGGVAPGQNAGWLGATYDPFVVTGDPNAPNFRVSGLALADGVSPARLTARHTLLNQLNAADCNSHIAGGFDGAQGKAFDLLTSASVQQAFDLNRESAETRERYGRHIHGQGLLLARRLVEAGVSLVCVNWHHDHQNFWDTHGNNFNRLKNDLMPPTDRGFSALLDDLADRGMLDETLLVWVGEFGRRPRITADNAGREHWPWCASAVMAGGGVQGGRTYGRSDALAAYPAENPVSPADITATIYHALGIPADLIFPDRESRPVRLTEGNPLSPLFA
ncbi:MAG: DUF1501 domain-containing protein [Planctomycetes bacterium]|nr:DUF1501 domain-containing protein [Planctomycetota bacterium]